MYEETLINNKGNNMKQLALLMKRRTDIMNRLLSASTTNITRDNHIERKMWYIESLMLQDLISKGDYQHCFDESGRLKPTLEIATSQELIDWYKVTDNSRDVSNAKGGATITVSTLKFETLNHNNRFYRRPKPTDAWWVATQKKIANGEFFVYKLNSSSTATTENGFTQPMENIIGAVTSMFIDEDKLKIQIELKDDYVNTVGSSFYISPYSLSSTRLDSSKIAWVEIDTLISFEQSLSLNEVDSPYNDKFAGVE